jgi:ATP-dependent DNA helicase
LPTIFANWEQFESWFDFSDLQDEEGTEEFLQDKIKQDLVKKMHLILQPLLLRRIKADVEHLLPKKREYVLYAPMTQEQTDLYNVINDKSVDTRQYLEEKVVERLTGATNTPAMSRKASPTTIASKTEESDSEEDIPLSKLAIKKLGRGRPPKGTPKSTPKPAVARNAFEQMMQKKTPASAKGKTATLKRKSQEILSSPITKSTKSSRQSTPASSIRGRSTRKRKSYTEADATDEDELSDDEFEQKLAEEMAGQDEDQVSEGSQEEIERAKTLELASKLLFSLPEIQC